MKTYQTIEAVQHLDAKNIEGWEVTEGSIKKHFKFRDFKAALDFMVKVGGKAEEMNHHPNWSNVYNKVDISLSTHDSGGITDKDFELAAAIEAVYQRGN